MSQLFETIRIVNGEIKNLAHHNQRCNKARLELFELGEPIDLNNFIHIPIYYQSGLVKCRISYDRELLEVAFQHYTPREIHSIKTVEANDLKYDYKFEDRKNLSTLFYLRQGHSEILIIKNGSVTDCFYYNVAFYDGNIWWTPESPLLEGTMRAKLLKEEKIKAKIILEKEIKNYQKIALFNALNPIGKIILEIDQIS